MDVAVPIDLGSMQGYALFLKVKSLPRYGFQGRTALVPEEYMSVIGSAAVANDMPPYVPSPFLFDEAILLHRRFYGCEIKTEYYETCLRNCERAMASRSSLQLPLFAAVL